MDGSKNIIDELRTTSNEAYHHRVRVSFQHDHKSPEYLAARSNELETKQAYLDEIEASFR